MFAKCRYMDEITGNRGVIFATGTPVSNSMTELYTMQRYLQYERLQELNMTHFDCWASRFGETVTALELAPEGTGYRARTRFSKFFNLPELMNLFKEVADIKTADQLNLPTPEVEYHNIVAQPTEHQQEMVKTLSERASLVHSGTVDPSQDNMLKITSDGRTALELAPEGTGYRARTRFSKFFNLPELMNLFKEVADIKTADQLNLPTPEVEYHNIVAQPTEHQQEMVKTLSERASLVHSGTVDPSQDNMLKITSDGRKLGLDQRIVNQMLPDEPGTKVNQASLVHSGTVDPSQDNMLKITSDGRKLGLDQRIVNQMLPDEPGTKVNQCVDNIMQIWRDGKADKLTQLVFCDISTPQAKAPASKAAKTLDNPLLHALEGSVPLPEQEPVFTVYDDIRQKLIA